MEAKHETQYFDFTNKEHKHFFAGLFNTAQHHFDLSLTELADRINEKGKTGKGFIKEAFSDAISEADWETRINYLSESLTFINYFDYDCRTAFREIMLLLYDTITNYRNYYSHYQHKKVALDDAIFPFLDELLFKSALNVKRNRAKSEIYKAHLSVKYKSEFDKIIAKSNEKIEAYNAQLKKGEKKRAFIKQKDEVNHVLNQVFRSFLYKNDNGEETLSEYALSKTDEGHLSTYGFVQLAALFLSKKQTESLLNYTKYLKDTRELRFVSSRWTFTFLCYRDIKRLFRSDYSNDSLLLQMISELNKCPDALYQHLSPEKKQEFLEDINTYYKDNSEFFGTQEKALVSHEVLQKRYSNKFAYFALRFLDEVCNFPTLRFSINLGKFNHDTSPKTFNSKVITERSLLEKITVFTKLSEATDAKKAYFKNPENIDLVHDWLEFPMPSYQFNRNNIGIWLAINDDSGKSDAATKRNREDKKTKYAIAEKLGLTDTVKKPIAFLSSNELPALLYALLIENKTPNDVESLLRKKIQIQRGLLDKFGKRELVNRKVFPKKLLQSRDKLTFDIEKLKQNITTEIKKNPLKDIRKKYKKKPKEPNELTNKEKGNIATWLADDIKRFTSKATKKDWKGYQYAEFQALLSFYDIDKEKPKSFLEQDLHYHFKIDNPFGGVNFNHKSLYTFYNTYLKKREKYLEDLTKTIDANYGDIPETVFIGFTKRIYEIKPVEIQKDTLLNKIPINLPRGIFDDKPTSYDKKEKPVALAGWFEKSNQLENAQRFYHFEKVYEYPITVLKWNPKKRKKEEKIVLKEQSINPNKGLKEQYYENLPVKNQREIYNNEKRIRKIMRQDFFVLEMAKHLLQKAKVKGLDDLQLKDIFLTKKEKNKIQEESKKQSERNTGDTSKNSITDSHILSRKIEISILDGRVKGTPKIKDVGKCRKFETDARVKELVNYFCDKTWSFTEIQNEIDDFDRVRKFELFKSVHQLEKKIYEDATKKNCTDALLNQGNPSFKRYVSHYFLETDKEAFNNLPIKIISATPEWQKFFLLAKIRNKFSHNQFLPTEDFKKLMEFVPLEKDELIATYLNRAFIELQKR